MTPAWSTPRYQLGISGSCISTTKGSCRCKAAPASTSPASAPVHTAAGCNQGPDVTLALEPQHTIQLAAEQERYVCLGHILNKRL